MTDATSLAACRLRADFFRILAPQRTVASCHKATHAPQQKRRWPLR